MRCGPSGPHQPNEEFNAVAGIEEFRALNIEAGGARLGIAGKRLGIADEKGPGLEHLFARS